MSTSTAAKVSYSAREAADRHGVSVDTIYNLIKANSLAAKRVGTKYVIPADELDRWYESLPDA